MLPLCAALLIIASALIFIFRNTKGKDGIVSFLKTSRTIVTYTTLFFFIVLVCNMGSIENIKEMFSEIFSF
jgi:hypothetical protein